MNQSGVPIYDTVPTLAPLDADRRASSSWTEGAALVDARAVTAFAAGHVPGSLSIELRPVFASWLGWLTEPDQPVVFVLDDDQDETDLVRQALTIGHDNLAGRLAGGFDAWLAAGLPVETTELVEPDAIDRPLLDIRQDNEFVAGHVPGAAHVELGALADGDRAGRSGGDDVRQDRTGHDRAPASCSGAGHADVAVLRGGFSGWTRARGPRPGHWRMTVDDRADSPVAGRSGSGCGRTSASSCCSSASTRSSAG